MNLLLRTGSSVLFRAPRSGEKGCVPCHMVRVDHQVVVSMELNGSGDQETREADAVNESYDLRQAQVRAPNPKTCIRQNAVGCNKPTIAT